MPPMSWTPSTPGTILQRMPHYDLPLPELRSHRCAAPEPPDLDDYWPRAVETAAAHPQVDAERICVSGASQGGGLSLAAAALAPELVRLCHADIPFLCDIERAITLAPAAPYTELAEFLRIHTELEEVVA